MQTPTQTTVLSNPNLKKPIGISLPPHTDKVITEWVDHLGKRRTFVLGERKPTRGTVITEIVEKLQGAGWMPGDSLKVVGAKARSTSK